MPHRRTVSEANINKNVNWLGSRGIWAWYISLVVLLWLVFTALTDDAGLSWSYTHLLHGAITYYLLHWTKGSPCVEDQGRYNKLTFWEQMDNETYGTNTRKFFTIMPLVLFSLATHGTDFRKQPLGLNLAVVAVLLVAKLPAMHRVRILGIGRY